MMEKHRRRKQPRCRPHFVWADPERFHVERLSAGLTQQQAAEYLGVSVRTMRNWETGCNRIPYPAFKPSGCAQGPLSMFRGGALVTPDGRTFQPWELQNLQLVVGLARRYMEARKSAPLREVA